MKSEFEIMIVGAGVVGLTTALMLAARVSGGRVRISLIDAGGRPRFSSDDDVALRVSAISTGSAVLLDRLAVWQNVAKLRACPYRDMRVWDAAGHVEGPETLRFDAAEFAVPQLGYIVENVLLQNALLEKLESSAALLRFDTAITSLQKSGSRYAVEFGDGQIETPDLLIGADGAASFVRQSAGIEIQSRRYPQAAFVTHLQPQRLHRHTAWQRFLPSGPIALLPLADGRVSTVWSTTPQEAESALDANDETLANMLTEATDGVLGDLTPAGPRGSFPLRAQHAARYVCEGLALVGDAAHTVHPLAGQGANLGIADADVLADTVATALERGENPGDLPSLRRYERSRVTANEAMLHFTDGLNRLFSFESKAVTRLRGVGMALFNVSGPVRDHAVRVALGVRG